jgi:hypothetical protein
MRRGYADTPQGQIHAGGLVVEAEGIARLILDFLQD